MLLLSLFLSADRTKWDGGGWVGFENQGFRDARLRESKGGEKLSAMEVAG